MTDETRVAFVSLGCARNLVDSEKMLGQLAEAGCAITADQRHADVIVINTCGFLEAARREADDAIQEAVEHKAAGTANRVVVAGCLVQRDGAAILERISGIDALVGVNNRDDLVRAVLGDGKPNTNRSTRLFLGEYYPYVQMDDVRLRLTPRHYAYLCISEGCDHTCTFCTIPAIRGRMHAKPPRIILNEARELIGDGAVELILIGQDTTSYGLGDNPLDIHLAGLLRQLDRLDGLGWLRLMYAHPKAVTGEIIDAIAECDRVCKYIDLPLQHINDRILKAMNRGMNRAATEQLLQRIRDRIPGVTIRTTLIAGFPGETDKEFEELRRFIQDFHFDALGVFPYSFEPDTPAARMKHQVSDAIKQERLDALMIAQQKIAFDLTDQRVGSVVNVLVDQRDETGTVVARHQGQAPVVDGVTYVANCDADPGRFLPVRCTGRQTYDMVATPTRVALPPTGT